MGLLGWVEHHLFGVPSLPFRGGVRTRARVEAIFSSPEWAAAQPYFVSYIINNYDDGRETLQVQVTWNCPDEVLDPLVEVMKGYEGGVTREVREARPWVYRPVENIYVSPNLRIPE